MSRLRVSLLIALLLSACMAENKEPRRTPTPSPRSPSPTSASFDLDNVVDIVHVLAGEIGPRESTTDAYRRAREYVARRLRALGYRVTTPTFRVPAGLSNLVAVPDGETFNVVAEPPAFDPLRPHLVVGAHLDTVPQAPGAVDNATGVGIVLELARLASLEPPRVPVVFVAFGGEEARVPKGGLHGSKAFVAGLTPDERAAITGAIVIDRVGTGSRVPVCTASESVRRLAGDVLDAARRVDVPAFSCANESSDHVSFVRAGVDAVRIGPDDFPEYHTPRDVPAILVAEQARRAGVLLWEVISST